MGVALTGAERVCALCFAWALGRDDRYKKVCWQRPLSRALLSSLTEHENPGPLERPSFAGATTPRAERKEAELTEAALTPSQAARCSRPGDVRQQQQKSNEEETSPQNNRTAPRKRAAVQCNPASCQQRRRSFQLSVLAHQGSEQKVRQYP